MMRLPQTIPQPGSVLSRVLMGWMLLFWYVSVAANILVTQPVEVPAQGESAVLTVTVRDQTAIRVILYYRVKGVDYFQRLVTPVDKSFITKVQIPATALVAPGMEYYLEVIDEEGNFHTWPQQHPRLAPAFFRVASHAALNDVTLVSPPPDLERADRGLTIEIRGSGSQKFEPGWIELTLDDTDITDLISVRDQKITFNSGARLKPGKHHITLTLNGVNAVRRDKSWTFHVADKGAVDDYFVNGGVSLSYGQLISRNTLVSSNTLSGSLNVAGNAVINGWRAHLSGAHLRYVKDSIGDDLTLSSDLQLVVSKGAQSFEYGDITIDETALTAAGFSRRGLRANLAFDRTRLRLFDVSSGNVSGFSSGLSSEAGQVYGLGLDYDISGAKPLNYSLVFINGENRTAESFNTATAQASSKGSVLGVAWNAGFEHLIFSGELARSHYDSDTLDQVPQQDDSAMTFNLSGTLGMFSTQAAYYRYGSDFSSIANPFFTADREGVSASLSTTIGVHTLAFSMLRNNDNVDKDASRPVVYDTTGNLSWAVFGSDWPGFQLALSRSDLNSRSDSRSTDRVKSHNESISLNISKSLQRWNFNWVNSLSRFQDEAGALDGESRAMNLAASYVTQGGATFSSALGVNETESAGVMNRTRIAAVSGNISLFEKQADSAFQLSWAGSEASDGSVNNTSLAGSWRLSMNLHDKVKKWFGVDFGRETLAVTLNYNRSLDELASDGSDEDVSVYISLSFSAPYKWSFFSEE